MPWLLNILRVKIALWHGNVTVRRHCILAGKKIASDLMPVGLINLRIKSNGMNTTCGNLGILIRGSFTRA